MEEMSSLCAKLCPELPLPNFRWALVPDLVDCIAMAPSEVSNSQSSFIFLDLAFSVSLPEAVQEPSKPFYHKCPVTGPAQCVGGRGHDLT